ncbi:hypothetical protein EP331_14265 [bacterium]|nr:MAG: hypothetical protein EP331_14265 [bacterium]
MKKILTFASLLTCAFFFTPTDANAQWTLGGGLVYADNVGIGVNFYRNTDDLYKNTRGGGDIHYYFVDGYSLIEITANAHYFFLNKENMAAYGIVGTTYMAAFGDNAAASVSGILNVGAGGEFGLSFGKAFAEARYMLGYSGVFGINAGVRISL